METITKAAVYSKTKSGKLLQILDVDTPIPKEIELLLKVCIAPVISGGLQLCGYRCHH